MSSPTVVPHTDHKGPEEYFTDYLQHSIGLCEMFMSVENSSDPDFARASARPAVARTGQLRRRGIEDGELDVRRLRKVLDVSVTHRRAEVQGWCPMSVLTAAAACAGMVPAVVSPCPWQTAGDAAGQPVAGPSSFSSGTFSSQVHEVDVASPDGILRTTGPAPHGLEPELFASLTSARGAKGPITRAVIALIPAGPFVLERREWFSSPAAWLGAARQAAGSGLHLGEEFDLLDGAMTGGGCYLSSGRFMAAGEARELASSLGIAAPSAAGSPAAAVDGPGTRIWRTPSYFFRCAPPAPRPRRHLPPEPLFAPADLDDLTRLASLGQAGQARSSGAKEVVALLLAPTPAGDLAIDVPTWFSR